MIRIFCVLHGFFSIFWGPPETIPENQELFITHLCRCAESCKNRASNRHGFAEGRSSKQQRISSGSVQHKNCHLVSLPSPCVTISRFGNREEQGTLWGQHVPTAPFMVKTELGAVGSEQYTGRASKLPGDPQFDLPTYWSPSSREWSFPTPRGCVCVFTCSCAFSYWYERLCWSSTLSE